MAKNGSALAKRPTNEIQETKWAVSERGRVTRHSEAEVDLALKLMVLNGGRTMITEEQLASENVRVHRNTLKTWRDHSFPRKYAQIRHELGREVTEEIAGRALERAMQYDDAEKRYIKAALEKIDQVDPTHLAKNAGALANAKSASITAAQLLRDRPTEIVEHRSVDDLVSTLERLGVAKKDEAITVEVEED
jgi:hypothetical protein